MRGRKYWYFQYTEPSGKLRQAYVGPDNEAVRALMTQKSHAVSPGLHRGGVEPFVHPQIGVTLQPLKFMEFSLVDVQQSVLLSGDQAAVVSIPHPARYALHKLIIYGERKGMFAVKSTKDLMQAGMLLTRLKETRSWEVEAAWSDLLGRGKGWTSRVREGWSALATAFPDLAVKEWLAL